MYLFADVVVVIQEEDLGKRHILVGASLLLEVSLEARQDIDWEGGKGGIHGM